ncbi:hypothetical protein CCR75_002309 [Bremia lactucae]|uniref:PX domain-containing protein n=1 Tax=Bremia lactucae TaxID=4779 RepID=A0A976FIZ9_BRELC|nr:hypothetical protein CCR75_002309 [Bremia lactucae]
MSKLVVSIGHAEFTANRDVLYVIKVQQDEDEWEVRRTYSDFRKLRDDVQRTMKDARAHILDDSCSNEFALGLQELVFPSKRLFGSKKDHVVKERAVELYRFLIKLLFLTHKYRKAQKTRYEQYMHALPNHQKEAFAALQNRSQASISVFYQLRDFLKPHSSPSDGLVHSGDLPKSDLSGQGDSDHFRLIRESRMLAMTTSSPKEPKLVPHKSANHVLGPTRKESRTCLPQTKEETHEMAHRTKNHTTIPYRSKKTTTILKSTPVNEPPKPRHYSTPDGTTVASQRRNARAKTSVTAPRTVASSSFDEPEPEHEKALKPPFSTSSSTLSNKERNVSNQTFSTRFSKSSKRDSLDQSQRKSSQTSKPLLDPTSFSLSILDKKRFSRTKRKAKTVLTTSLTESERLSRMSSALKAQAISISAQRELEKHLNEYSAIMVLRYVDRFINRAVMKAPGCYRVDTSDRLVIDAQRFLHELEDTFTDLPPTFGTLFQIGTLKHDDEWGIPSALNQYVQLKWDSFQAMNSSRFSYENDQSSVADHTSDSEDSEYEYEEVSTSGYLSTPKHHFSTDEESMLQEMIANGTAGREQMLRLRRQTNEQGWHRRQAPISKSHCVVEEASSSGSDDDRECFKNPLEKRRSKRVEAKRSVSCVVEKYQQEQNARRKDRLSQFGSQSIGGFV